MKERRLSAAMSGIDFDMIIDAMPAPAPAETLPAARADTAPAGRKGRGIRAAVLIAAACVLLLVGAAAMTVILRHTDDPAPPVPPADTAGSSEDTGGAETETRDPDAPYVDPVFSKAITDELPILISSQKPLGGAVPEDFMVFSGRTSEIGIGGTESRTFQRSGAPDTWQSDAFGGYVMEYAYSIRHYETAGSDAWGRYMSTYDVYTYRGGDDGANQTVYVMSDTGMACLFYSSSDTVETMSHPEWVEGKWTDEQLYQMSLSFLKAGFPDEDLSGYEFDCAFVSQFGLMQVVLMNRMGGRLTENAVSLEFDRYGKVCHFSGFMIGAFTPFAEVLTEEKLTALEASLTEKANSLPLPDGTHAVVSDGVLRISTTGVVYMQVNVFIVDDKDGSDAGRLNLLAPVPGAALIFPEERTEAETRAPDAPYIDLLLSTRITDAMPIYVNSQTPLEGDLPEGFTIFSGDPKELGIDTEWQRFNRKEASATWQSDILGGVIMTYAGSFRCSKVTGSDEWGQYLSAYDTYIARGDNGTFKLAYVMCDTGRLCYFTWNDTFCMDHRDHPEWVGKWSDETVYQMSGEYMKAHFPDLDLSTFEPYEAFVNPMGLMTVKFFRRINGFLTEESFSLQFDCNGDVRAFDGMRLHAFEPFDDVLSEENLSALSVSLKERVDTLPAPEGTHPVTNDGILRVSTDGVVWMQLNVFYVNDADGTDTGVLRRLWIPVPGAALIFPEEGEE